MKNNKPVVLMAILPMLVMYFVPNLLSIPMVTLLWVSIVFNLTGPISMEELYQELVNQISSPGFIILLNIVSGFACLVIFIVWFKKLKKSNIKQSVPLGSYNPAGLIAGMVCVSLGYQYVGGYLVEILGRAFPDWLLEYSDVLDSAGLNTGGMVTLGFLFYAICVAPMVEELAFRGITMTYALSSMKGWGATVLSAGLFAIIHGNMMQICYTFVFALVLGRIFARTGKLWITIVTHLLFNLLSVFMEYISYFGDNWMVHFSILFASLAAMYFGTLLVIRSAPNRNV